VWCMFFINFNIARYKEWSKDLAILKFIKNTHHTFLAPFFMSSYIKVYKGARKVWYVFFMNFNIARYKEWSKESVVCVLYKL
jgi:hypothetical protein